LASQLDLFINRQWQIGSGPMFTSRNPMSEDIVWQGHSACEADVNNAVAAARTAFKEWSNVSLEARITCLEKFRDIVAESCDTLAETISKETGKPLWESKGEVKSIANKVTISIDAYRNRCPEVSKEQTNALLKTRHKPHGVIAILGPFNFPGHLPSGHIIPALLAGNTIVFKPSELTPLVGQMLIQCWEKSGLPIGVINLIQGGRATGRLLVNHPDINGLFFTGSWQTGKILTEQFAKHPGKILVLELGGNNPLIVSSVKDLKSAALITIQSAYLTSGQRCTCARRLIVPVGENGDAFIHELIKMIGEIKVGPYTDLPEPFMGPVISESAAQHLIATQDALKAKGGKPLIEMHLVKLDTALLSPGLIDITDTQNPVDEEVFGPLLQLIRVPDFDAAIVEANKTTYGLSAGLLSDKQDEYEKFYREIRAGVINWNTPLTGSSSAAPFGGIGRSGNFRPSAYYAADYCAYPVASMEATTVKLPVELPPGIDLRNNE
jgi:succinylglutamic semialdehyde dehydrogenase